MRTIEVAAPAAPGGGQVSALKYLVKVITPLFGGSVTPRKADPAAPIRVPSIRGHLRWWYRATVGRQYHTVAELRAAETEIFGDTAGASAVDVRVTIKQPGRPLKDDEVPLRQGDRLFPIFPGDYRSVLVGVEFELELRLPEKLKPTLETVLWAWSNFGGIGAKTRRGCGAVWIAEFAPKAYKDRSGIAVQHWSKRVAPAASASGEWPQLGETPVVRPSTITVAAPKPGPNGELVERADMTPLAAWRAAIEAYRAFRQAGPSAHGIQSFDLLGYAQGQRRMSSPVILRPAAWKEGTLAMPMVVPLKVANAGSVDAVHRAVEFLRKQQGFRAIGEY
ncbi:MAG: type III-B CRISPR module RAMP protein Cmr1 [Bryobacterales bacterium]|nr:type III-B CRISPR module RAMP protein Cmr1 [Bryobacterales bacterium]